MSSNGVERAAGSASGPMRCAQCDCTFKRSEHLKRHERIHDTHKRFSCSQCHKLFTRSDILRRHEATHLATELPNGARPSRTRACSECARSRERCSKTDPCLRCSVKGFHCIYPQPRSSVRQLQTSLSRVPGTLSVQSNSSHAVENTGAFLGSASYGASEKQMMPFNMANTIMSDYQNPDILQPPAVFPINWLPADDSLTIDYDSIVGLGVSSLDFFSLPNSSTSDLDMAIAAEQHSTTSVIPDTRVRANVEPPGEGQQSPIWTTTPSASVDRHMSSQSPHSKAVSSCDTPGGLYSTSANGARMPCTVRARRPSRFIPGGNTIPPISSPQHNFEAPFDVFEFPDTSHLLVEGCWMDIKSSAHTSLSLTETMFEIIHHEFARTCLSNTCGFEMYRNSTFLSLSALNMFIGLYFENFDGIVPIVHDQVAHLNDHWLLALAVCTVGCQYAEADEFSRSVEPLHEFLRRAIKLELNGKPPQNVGYKSSELALAQAMTLSHIGMLYSGSQRLLRCARSQHSSIVELSRGIAFSLVVPGTTAADARSDGHGFHDKAWSIALVEESKRRIGYTIWMIDCMVAYQFAQQPTMPPDLVPVPLPDDKLWKMRSAHDFAINSTSSQSKIPSLQASIVSLFQEKFLLDELGQFSRTILLHGVFREVFYIKDCLEGPLGAWIPSLQQPARSNQQSNCPSDSINGKELLSSRRNAALDCMDVLHWAANATIAKAAGAEHPLVLHLHLARTVILSPLSQIRTFADSIVAFTQTPQSKILDAARRKHIVDIERDILEWAQRDQCKARLAVLHSGCLFWHVRRYSCRAFYEPISVFLASLTLWAYSSYASRPTSPDQNIDRQDEDNFSNNGGNPSPAIVDGTINNAPEDNDSDPTFIHLDRPNDDEMVQFFVRFGSAARIRANIQGVGDIYSTAGPAKILREGIKILAAVSTAWGRTKVYVEMLQVLEQVASSHLAMT